MEKTVEPGVVHSVPQDVLEALLNHKELVEKWNKLTPLARNEWICWAITVKQPETRSKHIARLCAEILEGKKRPCCWPGCPHRNPNPQKWFRGSK